MTKYEIILAEKNGVLNRVYADEVNRQVAMKYTIYDEIAIIRQRDEKPEEYTMYFEYVESVKKDIKAFITECLGYEFK